MRQFALAGFTQDAEFRVFNFELVGEDRSRIPFAVRADLALSRKHGIRVQELPLLCRKLLEQRDEGEKDPVVTFTEAEMRSHADRATAERDASQKKKLMQRPPAVNVVRNDKDQTPCPQP